MSSPLEPGLRQEEAQSKQEHPPHDRKTLYKLSLIITILLLTLALSMYSGKDIFIFGYIVVIVYVFYGIVHHHRSWQELGLKHGFMKDFRAVWYYFGIDAIVFQILPPTLGIALVFGYYPELLKHITDRLSINFGSLESISAIGVLLAAALLLTLIEEIVFRVTIQEKLSWFIGTPGAILFTSVIFGLVHSVGTTGSFPIVLTDVAGVALDGAFFGIIYAKTHNLALTWATHYIADVVGLIVLVLIF
jgi:membrane protease YdiL (CAAX protease family)